MLTTRNQVRHVSHIHQVLTGRKNTISKVCRIIDLSTFRSLRSNGKTVGIITYSKKFFLPFLKSKALSIPALIVADFGDYIAVTGD